MDEEHLMEKLVNSRRFASRRIRSDQMFSMNHNYLNYFCNL